MAENKELKVTQSSIDRDVLDIMNDKDILSTLESDIKVKRAILNGFCEMLSELKGLRKDIDDFSQLYSVANAEKIGDYLKELQNNVVKEQKLQELDKKIHKSHKKSTKNSKKPVK